LNHLNNAYYPGGSSNGAGSSISAGIVPFCVATDAGGSVRIPANFNGIYGLKPTHHRTHIMQYTMCVTGPMAANVADLTIAYRVMTQPNPDCPTQGVFGLSIPPSPSAKRIMGVYRDWFNKADPPVREMCDRALDYFAAKRGYEIVDISIPYLPEMQIAHGGICITEMAEKAHLSSNSLGSAAAMQALKKFTQGETGGNQSQGAFLGLALSEASKVNLYLFSLV